MKSGCRRLVVTQRTDDKWGDARRETSPTDTQGLSVELCQNKKTDTLPSGRWQDNQTPTMHFKTPVKGMTLASVTLV